MNKFITINDIFLACSLFMIDKCFAEFSSFPVIELNADVGYNITLPCTKEKDSQVMWIRSGKTRKGITDILPNGNLFLSSLQKNDTGIYECVSETSDDGESDDHNVKSRVHLNVKSSPSALKNVTIVPSSVLALLQWSSVEDGGYPISNISLRYKEKNSLANDTWHEVHPRYLTSSVKQIDIYKLNPNTTYLFQVWATNKLGSGEVTNITTRTLYNSQEIELARHLLEGAETFDTRIWIAAVAVVMFTLVVLSIGVGCVLYHEGHISLQKNVDDDPEKIELIPNVILNPSYYEEVSKWKKLYENAQQEENTLERYHGNVSKPVRV